MTGRPPVRVYAALNPDEYSALRRHCDRIADQLGVSRVHGASVIRALLAELAADEALAGRVAATVAGASGVRHAA